MKKIIRRNILFLSLIVGILISGVIFGIVLKQPLENNLKFWLTAIGIMITVSLLKHSPILNPFRWTYGEFKVPISTKDVGEDFILKIAITIGVALICKAGYLFADLGETLSIVKTCLAIVIIFNLLSSNSVLTFGQKQVSKIDLNIAKKIDFKEEGLSEEAKRYSIKIIRYYKENKYEYFDWIGKKKYQKIFGKDFSNVRRALTSSGLIRQVSLKRKSPEILLKPTKKFQKIFSKAIF